MGGEGGTAHCDDPFARSWGAGQVSEVLALLPDAKGLWVAGYENAANLDRDGDSLGFVEYWPRDGRGETRYTSDRGSEDAISALTPASNGRVWFAGYSDAGGQGRDAVVGRLDRSGAELSFASVLLEADQEPRAIAVDGTRLVVAGYDQPYVVGMAVERWEDPTAFWFDISEPATPVASMLQRFTSDSRDGANGMAFIDGALRLGGWRLEGGARGAFVKWLSPDGTFLREDLVVPAPESSVAGMIAVDGELYVAGTTSATLGQTAMGGQDGFLGLLNEQGQFEWVRQFGSASADYMTAFFRTESGEFVVAGESMAGAGDGANIIAHRFDEQGIPTGSFLAGSPHDETVRAVVVDGCGNALVAGGTLGDLVGGSARKLERREAYVLPIDWE